jgi:DNA-binding IclR family transcriptional regulator
MGSIERAVDVLNCFDGQMQLSVRDVAMRLDLPETALSRVLLTLAKSECLQRHVDGTYQLAPKLAFGWLAHVANRLRDVARPELEQLATRFNETTSLAYLFEERIHVLDSIEGFDGLRVSQKVGRLLPPHCSSLGKAITAFQDRALAERILEGYGLFPRTAKTIVERHRLFKEFHEIRKTGVACDREESMTGGVSFAAALRMDGRAVVAAVSVSTPVTRMSEEREQGIQSALVDAARRITHLWVNFSL